MSAADEGGYCDGRPFTQLRMDAQDQGVVMRFGNGPGGCDAICAREAVINREGDVYHLFYDGAAEDGWRACLATSLDLVSWEKQGPVLDLGGPDALDSAAAISPWVIHEDNEWHMFYIGTPNGRDVPAFPYLTFKARSRQLAGPWVKQSDVIPFRPQPDTYFSLVASAGHVIRHDGEFLMFFSGTTATSDSQFVQRTLGIARTRDLNGAWSVDPDPVVPVEEQIENSSLYYEPANGLWFLFTNHVGVGADMDEYTDAVWVYWSEDPNRWDPAHKAVVLDGRNCTWSDKCIGMPSVIVVGNRLALFYDAPGGDSTSHLNRNIGLAWLDLPLAAPVHGSL